MKVLSSLRRYFSGRARGKAGPKASNFNLNVAATPGASGGHRGLCDRLQLSVCRRSDIVARSGATKMGVLCGSISAYVGAEVVFLLAGLYPGHVPIVVSLA